MRLSLPYLVHWVYLSQMYSQRVGGKLYRLGQSAQGPSVSTGIIIVSAPQIILRLKQISTCRTLRIISCKYQYHYVFSTVTPVSFTVTMLTHEKSRWQILCAVLTGAGRQRCPLHRLWGSLNEVTEISATIWTCWACWNWPTASHLLKWKVQGGQGLEMMPDNWTGHRPSTREIWILLNRQEEHWRSWTWLI